MDWCQRSNHIVQCVLHMYGKIQVTFQITPNVIDRRVCCTTYMLVCRVPFFSVSQEGSVIARVQVIACWTHILLWVNKRHCKCLITIHILHNVCYREGGILDTSCWNSTWAGGPARQSAASCPLGCCARGVGPVGSLASMFLSLCGPKPPRGFQTIWSGLCPRIPAQVYGLCPYWARYWVSLSLSPILAQCHQSWLTADSDTPPHWEQHINDLHRSAQGKQRK